MGLPNEVVSGLLSSSGDNDLYQVSRSLRFNSVDSTYLTRTIGSGNRQKFTWSFWIKITAYIATNEIIFNRPVGYGLPSIGISIGTDGTLNF